MTIYLAGENGKKRILTENEDIRSEVNILESFFMLKDDEKTVPLLKQCKNLFIDSGAFTFIQGTHKKNIDWDEYIVEYANFINKYDIDKFVELDIERLIGMDEVLRLRKKLENLTQKQSIPVWHIERGKEDFIKCCKEYPYVAYGSFITDKIGLSRQEPYIDWFIETAHKYGAKIHGLGYTSLSGLKRHRFDSVDSTAWIAGSRGGFLYRFKPDTCTFEHLRPAGNVRLKARESALVNFKEWVKFSNYAEKYL